MADHITEHALHRQTTFVHLLQAVAVAANEAASVDIALQTALDEVCEHIGWPVGHVYLANESGALLSTDLWHLADPERFAIFRTLTEALQTASADDLPGMVLSSGKPMWVADMATLSNAPRAALISDIGVRAGFAFPVLVGSTIAAVLEFFATDAIAPQADLLDVMGHIGAQLGRVIERNKAEAALRAAEAQYRALVEQIPAIVYTAEVDDLSRTRYVSPQIETILGFTPEEWLADSELWLKQVHPDDRSRILDCVAEARATNAPVLGEYRSLTRDGRIVWLRDASRVVRDENGKPLFMQGITLDITERKQAEEALAEERALLARRVEERTADLSAANAELARAARLKDEFLASMSHELRTPLNTILGLSEALQEEVYGPLSPRQIQTLQSIEESGRHLLDLINDILDLAKIGAGKLELQRAPVQIVPLCQSLIRMFEHDALHKQLDIKLSIDPAVTVMVADPRRMKQILANLLSNAVKFTPAGGSIGLEVRGDAERQAVELTVWDTGIGIAEEDFERLFKPFIQLDSRLARQYNGTGLGLALAYRMVEMHGGGITVTSTVGAGSRFTVSLPWEMPDTYDALVQPLPAQHARPSRRALVIEDSPAAAEQLAHCLAEQGIATMTRGQGGDAVALALESRPDLIVLDTTLPDTSGWEVLERLKADPRTRHIPVLLISAADERARALRSGAADCLVKPLVCRDILRALRQIAGGAPPDQSGPQAADAPEEPRATILLAKDSEANIATLSDYLRARGYLVSTARNGVEAVARAQELAPDIILMDIQMPEIDGLEATRRIRAHPELAQTPIIALTALAMPGDRERCIAAGANDYLSKPVGLKALAATIDRLLCGAPLPELAHV